MIFPDFRTLKAIFDWGRRVPAGTSRREIWHLLPVVEYRPGIGVRRKVPFEVFWESLLQRKSGFGSLCFHFREFMDEDRFNAHHLLCKR